MDYYQKYIKYKNKYAILKKMNILTHIKYNNKLLLGGMDITDEHIDTYFKMYNLISWEETKKLYMTSHEELDQYCRTVTKQLNECNPPYPGLTNELNESYCCDFKGLNIHKKSINRFNINSELTSKDKTVNFKFIKAYEKINPQDDKQLYYNYVVELIVSKLNNDFITNNKDDILEILSDNDFDVTDVSVPELIKIINNEEFMGLDDIIGLMSIQPPDEKYIRLNARKSSKIEYPPMQEYTNKLFEETKERQKIYHLYFSYGTTTNLERVNWKKELNVFIDDIKEWILDPLINCIVLGGHSFGSFVIQKLGIELIKLGVDLTKIVIIGSGCYISKLLNSEEIVLFKQKFANKHRFTINSYTDGTIIHHENNNDDPINPINPINTHILLCDRKDIDATDIDKDKKCGSIRYELIEFIKSKDFKGEYNIKLHTFANYSQKYFMLKK
jgi:hypothetical protein